jgi:3',5'-cyclic AMP phosphodiesterase CpdA
MLIILLLLLGAVQAIAGQDTWTGVARVVAVGDIHGDFKAFTEILHSAGIIDGKGKWAAGATHLVQTGDILDRGAESRKVMDLLMSLEDDAAKAGGSVHALIGNHEAMNIYGDLRYVSAGDYNTFRTPDSVDLRDRLWKQYVGSLGSFPAGDEKKKWYDEHPLGWVEHRAAFAPDGRYGKWLRSQNAIIKINDTLFVHGGISPRLLPMTLADINQQIADELKDISKVNPHSLVAADDGPLWYRALAQGTETDLTDHVYKLLQTYGAKRIVIAHTPTPGAVTTRFGGKVVMIDVGLSDYYGSRRACLLLEDGKLYAIHRGDKIPLPSESAMAYLQYLTQVDKLEPDPKLLDAYIRYFQATHRY